MDDSTASQAPPTSTTAAPATARRQNRSKRQSSQQVYDSAKAIDFSTSSLSPDNGAGPVLKKRSKPRESQLAENRAEIDGFSPSTLFCREDWTLFRNLSTLGQRAGVSQGMIPALVVKELVDNALDAGADCHFGSTRDGLYVEDDGAGLPGTDVEVAGLFSVARPLSSSKLLRLPTRGALGNGLRVVTGAVLASGGMLTVKTRGRALRLRPRDSDGGTDVERRGPWKGTGTRVEVSLGDALPIADDAFNWAKRAARLARGTTYKGKTSPWWYDSDSFYELTQAAGTRTVRELVTEFAGCTGATAGTLAVGLNGRTCESLTRDEADSLLSRMRDCNRKVKPKRLGAIGPELDSGAGYAREAGTFMTEAGRGGLGATIPYVIEAWASASVAPSIDVSVNRTPITAETTLGRFMQDRTLYGLTGCGLSDNHRRIHTAVKVG